jgi:LuxR family maltose regulon positive regulatory protein
LTEIRGVDLQFDQRAAAELFQLNGLDLSDDQLRVLVDRTQGWPVGLRLAAMSLSSTDDIADGIARFAGTSRSVAEYLLVEVLDQLSPADRDFMLKTSIAEPLSAPLATALTGRVDSQSTLETLVAANAFMVSLGGQDVWFRLHPLLRDLLQHRLAVEQPGRTRELHGLAAWWFADQGEPLQAIRHATAAQDWDEVGRLLTASALPLVVTPAGPALAARSVARQGGADLEHPGVGRHLALPAPRFRVHAAGRAGRRPRLGRGAGGHPDPGGGPARGDPNGV